MSDKIHASECKCCKCGEQAEVFWPMVDPDIPHSPYCRPCVEQAKMQLLVRMHDEWVLWKKATGG